MAVVFIPASLRALVGNETTVQVEGETVREVIRQLEVRYSGIESRLCQGNRLRPGLQVVVGDSVSSMGLLARVEPDDEVHFVSAVGGG